MKSYDHLNFSRASIVQFWASRYIMRLNLTSVWKVMTIWISRELPLFNFERLDILFTRFGHPSQKLWQFWISWELLLPNFERLDILCAWIGPPCEKLWPFEFLERFRWSIPCVSKYYAPGSDLWVKRYDHLNWARVSIGQFRASRYSLRLNRISEWKVMTVWISRELLLFYFVRLDILCAWIEPPS